MSMRSLAAVVCFCTLSPLVSAQPAKGPLRFISAEAEWVVTVDEPRHLLTTVEQHPLFVDVQKLAGVRDFYDTTSFQQLLQLVSYFEKQLGKGRDGLLDDVAGGGIVLGAKVTKPGGAVLVLQSRDPKQMQRFADLALDVIKQELERQESKDRIIRGKYRKFDVGQIGPKLRFAFVDGAIVIGSEEKALKAALDSFADKKGVLTLPSFMEAQRERPAKALAWTWLNVERLRANEEFQNGLNASALDPLQQVLFGGFTDLLRRAPYVSGALVREGENFRIQIQAPRGREGMSALSHVILPPAGDGTLPLLTPPRVVSSSSYYLDLGQLWEKRLDILGEKNAKGLEEGDRNVEKLLGGIGLAKLFRAMGPHQRLVFAQQKEQPYKVRPGFPFPSFALVVDMRDPSFAKDMNGVLKAGALASTFVFGLQLEEQTYKDCEIVTYYFSETKKVDNDMQNIRYNFSPSYVTVGNYYVMSATAELARDLVDLLLAEKKPALSKASMQTQLYADGFVDVARLGEDAALTQLILSQALAPKEAKAEYNAILNWTQRLGTLSLESNYRPNDFRYDILWRPKVK